MYKNCAPVLDFPLFMLLYKSLQENVFPQSLKCSSITPIFKNGNKSNIANYRPISILNSLSLIFESSLYKSIIFWVRPRINDSQHGFIAGKSTITNLSIISHDIASALDSNSQIDIIYTDFSKAFDKIHHPTILHQMHKIGFHPDLISWFASYLSDRQQKVVVCGSSSSIFTPSSGVPQGSILGPLIFTIYINDICSNFTSKTLLYADDLKLYREIHSIRDCTLLQRDIEWLIAWCEQNSLPLNISKCTVLTISRKRETIKFEYMMGNDVLKSVSEQKDLGIIFDSKYTFERHVSYIVNKANKTLGFLFRCGKLFRKIDTFIQIYNSLVRSVLEYGSVVWNPFYQVYRTKIERVQKKFTRVLFFKFHKDYDDYSDRLRQLNIVSLQNRRLLLDEIFLNKVISGMIASPILLRMLNINYYIHGRNSLTFRPPKANTNLFYKSPLIRIQRNHNSFFNDIDVFSLSAQNIKVQVLRSILSFPPY